MNVRIPAVEMSRMKYFLRTALIDLLTVRKDSSQQRALLGKAAFTLAVDLLRQ